MNSAYFRSALYVLILLLVLVDLTAKSLAITYLTSAGPLSLTSFLDFRLGYNSGAAFGLLSSAGSVGRWFLIVVSSAVVLFLLRWIYRASASSPFFSLGLAWIAGGALGNLYERLRFGMVTDFISLHWRQSWYFPTFNIADTAITIGVILLLLSMLRGEKQ